MIKPENLAKAFEKVEDDNWILRSFLKGLDDVDELDRLINSMHEELFKDYDCSQCRNCCKFTVPQVEEKDINEIANSINLSVDDFKNKYVEKTEDEYIIKGKPCLFFTEEGCKIHDCRPTDCKEYPYTNKNEMWSRLISLVQNSSICPIVFEILERLKRYYSDEFRQFKKEYRSMWGWE